MDHSEAMSHGIKTSVFLKEESEAMSWRAHLKVTSAVSKSRPKNNESAMTRFRVFLIGSPAFASTADEARAMLMKAVEVVKVSSAKVFAAMNGGQMERDLIPLLLQPQ
jgi:hypothetical protein